MWAFLPSWLVEDGEIPEMRVGQELSHVGLRASCRSIRYSNFPIPTTGRRVSVVGRLEVMADYEWDDFGFPDTRRDWEVVAVRVEHRAWVRNAAGVGTPGAVVRVGTAERIAAADLDRDLCSDYQLDLRPIR